MTETAYDMFQRVYEGSMNFMTPTIIRCGFKGIFAYELSKGEGISHQPIWGVTVLNKHTERRNHDLSKLFQSLNEAEHYIKKLSRLY